MQNYITISGIIEAITPIFHGGNEKTGSSPVLRTIYIWTKEGERPIPYIHGNSVRGKIRRTLIKDLLNQVGYEIKNKKLYHSLFSGGVLESTEENTGVLDLTFRKKIVDLLPPIALFGCAIGNQIIQGKLTVGHMWPLCQEYAPFLPENIDDPRLKQPIRIFTDSSFITRRDDLRGEREEDEQAVQMKVEYECLIPGSAFYHEFILSWANEIEKGCFAYMIDLWKKQPIVGGRSSSGDGKLKLTYEIPWGAEPYIDFLGTRREDILKLLGDLDE